MTLTALRLVLAISGSPVPSANVPCRGRVREYGGVSAEVEDQAGTLYALDASVAEPFDGRDATDEVVATRTRAESCRSRARRPMRWAR